MPKVGKILIGLIPLVACIILIQFLWRQSYLLAAIFGCILIADILLGRDKSVEIKVVTVGIVWGFILEVAGVNFSNWHYFTKPDIWGIPLWLPITWGYGFMMAKRIFAIIYIESSLKNK